MANKTIKQLQKEGIQEARQELKEEFGELMDQPDAPLPTPNPNPVDETTKQPIIQAKNADIGKEYLTVGMYYKVKVLKRFGDEKHVTSVQVQSETSMNPIAISSGTDLIEYQEQFHKPLSKEPKPKEKDSMSGAKAKSTSLTKEKKIKMSSIITPMLLEGRHTAEAIANAVIAKIPEKEKKRDKLIAWISGSYITYLKANPKLCDGKTPAVKPSLATEKTRKASAPKAEKPSEAAPTNSKKEKSTRKVKGASPKKEKTEAAPPAAEASSSTEPS